MILRSLLSGLVALFLSYPVAGQAIQSRLASYANLNATNTWTTLQFNSPDFATSGSVSGTISSPGVYTLGSNLTFLRNTNGLVEGRLLVNGAQVDSFFLVGQNSNSWEEASLSAVRQLQAGDTYAVQINNESGNQISVASVTGAYSSQTTAAASLGSTGVQTRLATYATINPTSTWTALNFNAVDFASSGATAGAAWTSGLYAIAANLNFYRNSNGLVMGRLLVNGSQVDSFYLYGQSSSAWQRACLSTLRNLQPGDAFSVEINNQSGAPVQVASAAGAYSGLDATASTIASGVQSRLSAPVVINPTSTWTTLQFNTNDFATPGATAGTAWASGLYDLAANLTINRSNTGVVEGRLLVNGTQVDSFYLAGQNGGEWQEATLAALRLLQPGDTFAVQINNESGSAIQVASATGSYSSFSALLVPEPSGFVLVGLLACSALLKRKRQSTST